ncbi:hypothetical protein GPECTOR_317g16 [Gonium pectorale]|uniref:Uncharacterized protein n=1 Tax=Gonium pectorale TaxID=33097 RepID=A0A150FVQ0_GONPE|nr:hypothetical protein GPECTOR_317g16 [Gonium pectorale]|eukprot:KXZ41694.1 hypothetical protein GPECTOR_317g16 [Gonium pectorale]
MMAASALASAMLKGDGSAARISARHLASNLLPVDAIKGAASRPSPARMRRRWDTAYKCCDMVLLILGVWLSTTSAWSMAGPAATHGTLLGAGCAVLGLLGLLCAGHDWLPMRSLMLVGLGLTALSTLQLMNQVGRDVQTHCALAEAMTRVKHLEERVARMRHDELITQLFFRMNEMDDMLGLVQQSASAQAEAHSAVWRAAQADKDYLRSKAQALRRHAAAVGESLKAKIAESKANATAGGADTESLSQSLWGVERRLEAVDSVIRYLDQKEAAGDLSYDEYEIILEALLEGSAGHVSPQTTAVLHTEKQGLGAVRAAFERHTAQAYEHVLAAGGEGASASIGAVTKVEARKASARRHFENRFMELFHSHGGTGAPSPFAASLSAALEALPEHCVRDVDAQARLRRLGWALLAAQAAAGYAALTAFVLVAKKDD